MSYGLKFKKGFNLLLLLITLMIIGNIFIFMTMQHNYAYSLNHILLKEEKAKD